MKFGQSSDGVWKKFERSLDNVLDEVWTKVNKFGSHGNSYKDVIEHGKGTEPLWQGSSLLLLPQQPVAMLATPTMDVLLHVHRH